MTKTTKAKMTMTRTNTTNSITTEMTKAERIMTKMIFLFLVFLLLSAPFERFSWSPVCGILVLDVGLVHRKLIMLWLCLQSVWPAGSQARVDM